MLPAACFEGRDMAIPLAQDDAWTSGTAWLHLADGVNVDSGDFTRNARPSWSGEEELVVFAAM